MGLGLGLGLGSGLEQLADADVVGAQLLLEGEQQLHAWVGGRGRGRGRSSSCMPG